MRQPGLDADQLVDLLLILRHRKAGLRVIEDEHHLLGHGVLVDRHRHGAEALGCQHRPVELWPVVADDGDLVAALHAERREAAGDGPHICRRLGPVPGLPDAQILLAHRRPVAADRRLMQHELRKCVVGRGLGRCRRLRFDAGSDRSNLRCRQRRCRQRKYLPWADLLLQWLGGKVTLKPERRPSIITLMAGKPHLEHYGRICDHVKAVGVLHPVRTIAPTPIPPARRRPALGRFRL